MHRCLIAREDWSPTQVTLSDAESHHLFKVMRARPGERVAVFDGHGRTADACVGTTSTVLEVRSGSEVFHKRPAEVTLFLALLKPARWELALEKAAELGVSDIVPLQAGHCVARVDSKEFAAKHQRWLRIVEGAAKQCGTPWIPTIDPPRPIDRLTFDLHDWVCVGALEGATCSPGVSLRQHLQSAPCAARRRLGIAIGPEGDFTADEMRHLLAAGAVPVRFGPCVLRAETAAIYGLSIIAAELADADR